MTAKEMTDADFINFQDDFYNLLEKYGVSKIDIEHQQYDSIIDLRNKVAEFIEQEMYRQESNNKNSRPARYNLEYLKNLLDDMRATLQHLVQDAVENDKPLDSPIIKMQEEKILKFSRAIKETEDMS
tara:strand:+ start:290 stop:670 length:381 start_codon:yes stop_codon:yes gene_type:complete